MDRIPNSTVTGYSRKHISEKHVPVSPSTRLGEDERCIERHPLRTLHSTRCA